MLSKFILRGIFALGFALLLSACQSSPNAANPPVTVAPTPTPIYINLIGRPIRAADRGEVYRLMEDGTLRHITDLATLAALAYVPQDIVAIPAAQMHRYAVGLPLTRWITSQGGHTIYFLQHGKRYPIADEATLNLTGASVYDVADVPDDYLNSFPLANEAIEGLSDLKRPSRVDAARWDHGTLWLQSENGATIKWSPGKTGPIPDNWHTVPSLKDFPSNSRVFVTAANWYADSNRYDFGSHTFYVGRGLIYHSNDGTEQAYTLSPDEIDPLKTITSLALDATTNRLWIGTASSGLIAYDPSQGTWIRYNTFNSEIADNHVNGLALAADGSLWLALPSGLGRFQDGRFSLAPVPDDITDKGVLGVAAGTDPNVWVSGDNFVGHFDGKWHLVSAFDNPAFMDHYDRIVLDDQANPWFVGEMGLVHSDTKGWTAYDPNLDYGLRTPERGQLSENLTFADPHQAYVDWLKTWPRPRDDNGRGVHYLAYPSDDPLELQQNVERLKRLGIHWLLVNYTSRSQLPALAKAFTQAGIMVIWRPFVRPYRDYPYWAQDIAFLRMYGIPPYIQVYNEPSLGQEWEPDRKVDQGEYLSHMLPAIQKVYDAGGYVGIQEIDLDWLRTVLQKMKTNHMEPIFDRSFFIPHAYGYNHPPSYDQDVNAVLGFKDFADVFQQEIGFVPMMVAGEGGWRPGEAQDSRYPMVTQTLHRDYLVTVFDWFRTGQLSNGQRLPDYLFAVCPWILSDPNDPAAWFDSAAGDRDLLIRALEMAPEYQRKFSWDHQSSF